MGGIVTSKRRAARNRPPPLPWRLDSGHEICQLIQGYWPVHGPAAWHGTDISHYRRHLTATPPATTERIPSSGVVTPLYGGTHGEEYASTAGWISQAAPVTFSCRLKVVTGIGSGDTAFTIGHTAQSDNNYQSIKYSTPNYTIEAASKVGGDVVSSGTIAKDTWVDVVAVFASSSSRTLYLDGVSQGEETSTSSPSGSPGLTIGGNSGTGTSIAWNGGVYNCALWYRALTAAEVWALHDQPWLLYWQSTKTIFIPAAAATGATISLVNNTPVASLTGGALIG